MNSASQPRYFSRQVIEAQRFYLNLRNDGGEALAVMSGGLEKCSPDYDNVRKTFAHPCIEFVVRGSGMLTLGAVTHMLTPGTVFTYGPHLAHRITSAPNSSLWKYFVVFTGSEGVRLLNQSGLKPGSAGHIAQPERVQWIFDDLISQGLGDHSDRVRQCATILQYLILKIGELHRPADDIGAKAFATYERVRRHIADEYETITCLSEIAASCAVDEAYICRLFRRFGRESPFQYLLHLRLNRAAELLQTTDMMVKDIAAQLRFTDAFNFSRSFRNAFGIAPKELRIARDVSAPLSQP
jgi:AraC-like DNA-binding protein